MQMIQGGKQEGGSFQDSPSSAAQQDAVTFVVLSLSNETFAVSVEQVKEIIRVPLITWVPGSRGPVKGVINLRGSIVPVLDLAEVLSLKPGDAGPDTRVVIVDTAEGMVGMLVESVEEVADIPTSALEPSMRTLAQRQKNFVKAQTNFKDVLVGVLDMDRVINESRSSDQEI